ncbi:MAG: hypothetical protein AAF211_25360 [Myxococcota bacterium]
MKSHLELAQVARPGLRVEKGEGRRRQLGRPRPPDRLREAGE